MQATAPRAAIYARLSAAQSSDASEASDSIANQLRDLRALRDRNGYAPAGEFADDGISGYKGKHRPAFESLLASIARGEVDVILARHSDRLERNEREGLMVRLASIRAGVRWHFASGMTLDPSTAEGGLLARILSALAEFESAVKSDRLRQHYEGSRVRGEQFAGRRPFGYLGTGADMATPHPDEAPLVRRAYDTIASGGSVYSVAKAWNDAGLPTIGGAARWSHAAVRAILTRPRNAGLVVHRGEVVDGVQGEWEPLVSVEQWRAVQDLLSDPVRRTNRGRKPVHLLGGLIECGTCGGAMRSNTARDKRSKSVAPVVHYRCTGLPDRRAEGVQHATVSAELAERDIVTHVFGSLADRVSRGLDAADTPPEVAPLLAERADLNRRRVQAQEIALLPGADVGHLGKTLAEIDRQVKAIDAEIDAASRNRARRGALGIAGDVTALFREAPEHHPLDVDRLREIRASFDAHWSGLNLEERRDLVRATLRIKAWPMATVRAQGVPRITYRYAHLEENE
jgi:site-specific DNA recombinase